MKNMIVKKGIQHFHDDHYSDKEITILPMPFNNIFGDYRIFNGLPIHIVDQFLERLREILVDIKQAHLDYEDYWKTHPNR